MTDLALRWNVNQLTADLAVANGSLATDAGLGSAIIVSLFTDRRAEPDDDLPAESADRRGWWGDVAPAVEGDLIGSRLWELRRSKRTRAVLVQAREFAEEALAWLVEDKIAASVTVVTEVFGAAGIAIGVVITRPGGPGRQRFDFVWEPTDGV